MNELNTNPTKTTTDELVLAPTTAPCAWCGHPSRLDRGTVYEYAAGSYHVGCMETKVKADERTAERLARTGRTTAPTTLTQSEIVATKIVEAFGQDVTDAHLALAAQAYHKADDSKRPFYRFAKVVEDMGAMAAIASLLAAGLILAEKEGTPILAAEKVFPLMREPWVYHKPEDALAWIRHWVMVAVDLSVPWEKSRQVLEALDPWNTEVI